jgi:dihydrofolate synthase/folylpolyglutamate synthase
VNYKQTLDYLFERLPVFQRVGKAAYKNNLDNTLFLDEVFQHPHRKYKTIHVAGTNGKGSVSHMLAAVLQAAGYKTGLYTSPHLKDFRERIKINGQMIPKNVVVDWVEKYPVKSDLWNIEPSFFELTVALAFDYFAEEKVDVAVIEVGLGGRLDSTNIITPEVSVITNIGLDHTNLLGNTLKEIAGEKAGIIKQNVPAVIGTTQEEIKEVFEKHASQKEAELFFADSDYNASYSMLGLDGKQTLNVYYKNRLKYANLKIDLLGMYQQKNVPAVLKTIDILNGRGWKIQEQQIYEGLKEVSKTTGLQGRWQIIGNNPLAVCDTGHNVDGITTIVEQIRNTPHQRLHFVFGVVEDKNLDEILKILPVNASYYFAKSNIPRAMDAKELTLKATAAGLVGECYVSVKQAFNAAKTNAAKNDMIFVGGSTFVVAEIL